MTTHKANGSIRVCGDYKLTINKYLQQTATTTPEPEDIFTSLHDQQVFSRFDLKNAFLQVPLDPESVPLTTVNTPWRLYQYKFLPFGVSASPGFFQKVMDSLIQDLPGVQSYQDDLLVFGKTLEEHDANLLRILKRLIEKNVTINPEKSTFRVNTISYLGYSISSEGITPDPDRLKAFAEAPSPDSFEALRSLMGYLQYYARFIPQFPSLAKDIYDLQFSKEWKWL